ncbi:hypothetical protein [Pseudothauera rhizosphaerae]|uniref:Uncharacterized protein n=1 Tax=Pseudothauera rhizosphaerae TaxID=2565932 RepID=A0A4V3WBS1_9RHOO|nr:hypothetical protein [Pseudothauera rhizosphaerae]THF64316.1 hypothetical protein E6O51_03120 [Pseudothauera rhizosphaerae]
MRVIATAVGFHGGSLHKPCDGFDVPDGSKASWYVPADKADVAPPKTRRKAAGPETLSDVTKADNEALGAGLV